MKKIGCFLLGLLLASDQELFAQVAATSRQLPGKRVVLPNGWSLTPVGRTLQLGDLPLNIAVSPSKKYIAVTNNGQSTQSIQLIDANQERLLDEVVIPKSWFGLAFSADEQSLYASGGNDNWILRYSLEGKKLRVTDTFKLGLPWPKEKICPTGLTLDDAAHRLYVVTKENNSLYVIDLLSKRVVKKIELGAEAYTCLLSPDKNQLYISLWGGDKVISYDTKAGKLTKEIPTGSRPNEMVLSRNGRYLFVANGNDNSCSVIDLKLGKPVETIATSLYPDAPAGSTSNSLALSADEKTLFIANADNNCLAVFDVTQPGNSHSKGFIPTGWYPTSVRVIGRRLFVANGKGFTSMANPKGPNPISKKDESSRHQGNARKDMPVQYIGGLFKGTLSIFEVPDKKLLATYSQAVYRNTPYNKQKETETAGEPGNPIPSKLGQPSPIKYVFYIIKENRTYDQVLGDVKEGNGDSSLCIFGQRITPNQHALVKEFVLLDNFYVDAEVSADGHNWSTAAYANDYVEKTWPTSYGGRGGSYDYEGSRPIAYPKKGFIWDYCQRAGVSYRTYGEFSEKGKASIPVLKGHVSPHYPGFDLSFKDIDREKIWEQEFDSLVAANALPQFNSIRFGNDHTSGLRKGAYSPFAAVADNDLAVGRFVEHLSHSPVWKQSAVFILEDDAQNGADHVDAHRSTAYLISPYVKRKTVNHTMYSTSGLLRTIELILGLPPMSQYDAAANPMWECFTAQPDLTPFTAKPANVNLEERNVVWNESARRSEKFNLTKEDSAPDLELNEVIWKAVKGEQAVMPPPRRSAFVKVSAQEKEAD